MLDIHNPFCNASSYAACLGIDWGHSKNCIHLLASGGDAVERFDVDADATSMRRFVGHLRERFPAGRIAAVSEQCKGALVNLLLDFEFIDALAVNPQAAAKFRRSLHPSGAKSDPIDSSALLRMIFTHKDRLRELSRGDDASRRLDAIARHRRKIVEQRVEVALRLKALLLQYYPQATPMLGSNVWDPISLAFLRKWPCHSRLAKAKEETLRRFYHANGSRSEKAIAKRLASCHASAALSSDALIEELGELQMKDLIEQLMVLNKQVLALDKRQKVCFSQHPDKEIFSSFPGAGPTMAPRLAAAFGGDRERFRSCSQMQAYVGIAPIKVSSGKSDYTFMRRFCPKFIRQSFHEWAGLSIEYSLWAKACYRMFRDRGMRAGKAKRAIAFKWMRIMYSCWKCRKPYDEQLYIRSLIEHDSPIVDKMKELGFIDEEIIYFLLDGLAQKSRFMRLI